MSGELELGNLSEILSSKNKSSSFDEIKLILEKPPGRRPNGQGLTNAEYKRASRQRKKEFSK